MDELLQYFVTESKEHLESIEDDFVMMGQLKDTPDPELANKVFRAIHTIKGVAGFVGQKNIGELSHIMESILQKIKLEEMAAEIEVVDALLEGVDYLNQMLDDPEHSNECDISSPLTRLDSLLEKKKPTAKKKAVVKKEAAPIVQPPDPGKSINLDDIPEIEITDEMRTKFVEEALDLLDGAEETLLSLDKVEDTHEPIHEAFRAIHSFKGNCGFFGLAEFERVSHKVESKLEGLLEGYIEVDQEVTSLILEIVDFLRIELCKYHKTGTSGSIMGIDGILDLLDEIEEDRPQASEIAPQSEAVIELNDEREETAVIPEPQTQAEPEKQELAKAEAEPQTPPAKTVKASDSKPTTIARQDIRVDLAKLDTLINLVGELVIAETMVVRNPVLDGIEDEGLERSIHHLNRISSELQDIAMSVRMVPLATTFRKMTRLVYDLSNKGNKKVDLKLIGEETEVDKTVIESIGDPLVHIVRNAIDHGLETSEERALTTKSETGNVSIEAVHEGGEVLIIIKDDGRGLNKDKILKKAIEKNITPENGPELRDDEIFKMIFEPGFSTADKITDISGRGVGMDVVKRNIEKLKGRIEVTSILGEGTTFILHIPLTLAIIDGMLVSVGNTQYTIPLLSIRESLRPVQEMITLTPTGQEIIRIRDEMIPVLRLHTLYKKVPKFTKLEDGLLVIVESGNHSVALFVDELLGQQQTVIKPLSGYLGDARAVSGCTILGNGEVSLILDVASLIDASEEK